MLIVVKLQKRIQNPAKHLRWSFFRKFLWATETNPKSCQTSKIERFAKVVKDKVLNMLLKWLPMMFYF